jgi:leucyl-tRNA---protein transferase
METFPKKINEYGFQNFIPPAQMDFLWALGWRHFGEYFFRYSETYEDEILHVQPVRIDLQRFSFSDSQKRILRKNADLSIEIVPTIIDAEKEALFELHKQRFEHNVPNSLYTFLSQKPDSVPCENLSVEVRKEGKLLAVSFLDVGENATSSVYAIFHPEEGKRSLGVFTMLLEIQYSLEKKCDYYYSGYTYLEPSHYDYKKHFRALERYNWEKWE